MAEMSDYAELVKKLERRDPCFPAPIEWEAADAIKALVQEKQALADAMYDIARAEGLARADRMQSYLFDQVKQRAERAESALAECMKHATDLANDLEMMNAEPFPSVRAFHQWRAKQ